MEQFLNNANIYENQIKQVITNHLNDKQNKIAKVQNNIYNLNNEMGKLPKSDKTLVFYNKTLQKCKDYYKELSTNLMDVYESSSTIINGKLEKNVFNEDITKYILTRLDSIPMKYDSNPDSDKSLYVVIESNHPKINELENKKLELKKTATNIFNEFRKFKTKYKYILPYSYDYHYARLELAYNNIVKLGKNNSENIESFYPITSHMKRMQTDINSVVGQKNKIDEKNDTISKKIKGSMEVSKRTYLLLIGAIILLMIILLIVIFTNFNKILALSISGIIVIISCTIVYKAIYKNSVQPELLVIEK